MRAYMRDRMHIIIIYVYARFFLILFFFFLYSNLEDKMLLIHMELNGWGGIYSWSTYYRLQYFDNYPVYVCAAYLGVFLLRG